MAAVDGQRHAGDEVGLIVLIHLEVVSRDATVVVVVVLLRDDSALLGSEATDAALCGLCFAQPRLGSWTFRPRAVKRVQRVRGPLLGSNGGRRLVGARGLGVHDVVDEPAVGLADGHADAHARLRLDLIGLLLGRWG